MVIDQLWLLVSNYNFFLIYLFIACIKSLSSLWSLSATSEIDINTTDWTVIFSVVQ